MFLKDLQKDELPSDVKLNLNLNIRFSDFPLHRSLIDALSLNGFIFPSPVQYHILSQGTIDENLLIQAKSGTGKTIAFVLFTLNKILDDLDHGSSQSKQCFELKSLIVAPTREICAQISRTISIFLNSFKDIYSISNICCIGGSPISEDFEKFHYDIPTIMTSTPGRFIQIINFEQNQVFSINIIKKSLIFMLFDEADRLLEDCFIEQSMYLLELFLSSSTTQFIASSATFPIDKLQLLKKILYKVSINKNDERLFKLRQIQLCSSLGKSNASTDCFQVLNHTEDIRNTSSIYPLSKLALSNTIESPVLKNMIFFVYDIFLSKILELDTFNENNYYQWSYIINSIVDILIRVPFRQSLIFTNNSSVGYKIMSVLRSLNIPSLYTNGKRSQVEREEIITSLNENKCRVVVCSDLLARGIDIKMVDLIINVDVPADKETFLHRAGRSGRFGQKGVVICIPSNKQDFDSFSYFSNQLGIKFLNFCEHLNHIKKSYTLQHPSESENCLNLDNDHILDHLKLNSRKGVFSNLKDSDCKHLDEKSQSINSPISIFDQISPNYKDEIHCLQITVIDKDILNCWRC